MKQLIAIVLITSLEMSYIMAADLCIRSGPANNGDGTTWASAASPGGVGAFNAIPANLVRGNNYYMAVGTGSYGTYFFDDNESSTTLITMTAATIANHGPSTGWSDAYAGQVVFDNMIFNRDYYLINGQGRDADWNDYTAYGFRVAGGTAANSDSFPPGGDHNTVRYADLGGDEDLDFVSGIPNNAVELTSFTTALTGWNIDSCRIHNVKIGFRSNGIDGNTIQNCFFTQTFGKEAIMGLGKSKNMTVANNIFLNTCRDDPEDETSNGATADIASWASDGAGDHDGWLIYGNVIINTMEINHSDASILIGGNGGAWLGVGTSGTKVYNNTIVGISSGAVSIQINGTGNFGYNNLGYNLTGTFSVNANTTANNGEESSDPFVNLAGMNFHLTAAIAGTTLTAGYNTTDPDGIARAVDGVQDRGAFEFNSGSEPPPEDPSYSYITTGTRTVTGTKILRKL